ncbi:MAG: carboxymuconolactone decarboxylase family protein [Methanosarcinaceae archaeon]|nr:carboxymuconolactone decarboxylase family protein [Methanosarcinaceae archaeon]
MTEKSGKEILKSIDGKTGFSPQILEVLCDLDEDFVKKYGYCNNKLLTDGALPAKTKILMALAVVASKQCESCVMAQMRSAIHNGATKEEIMETLDVISITSGAPAVAACRNALNTLLNKKDGGSSCRAKN